MVVYPYAHVPKKLEGFLQSIQRSGVPEKATTKWLKSCGYTSSNDVSMINVLKFIGFVDASRVPTETWQAFRDLDKSAQVLSQGIREGYQSLFQQYPDAEKRSPEELSNFFRANSSLGERAISLMSRTFQVLCALADFNQTTAYSTRAGENGHPNDSRIEPLVSRPDGIESPTPALHIDFQVHISADAPPEQIDKIFESMAKHLYGNVSE